MNHLEELLRRYPVLAPCRPAIEGAFAILVDCYAAGGKLLICGNGGSAADADHIVGELMKGFLNRRPLPENTRQRLVAADPQVGPELASKLQAGLPAINLSASSALGSAFANDVSAELAYAQAALAYGRPGDALLGISTSGNAANVRAALCAARAAGLRTVGLTGKGGGRMAALCDVLIDVPATRTFEVQELHLPIYHALCAMVESRFFA
jgi:D-sedoheptulose 7-phosphate isomerase